MHGTNAVIEAQSGVRNEPQGPTVRALRRQPTQTSWSMIAPAVRPSRPQDRLLPGRACVAFHKEFPEACSLMISA